MGLHLSLNSSDLNRVSEQAKRVSFIILKVIYSILGIFLFWRSVNKNSSFLLTRVAYCHIPGNRLIHFLILIGLHSVEFFQPVKNFRNDWLRSCLIMSAVIDENLLKFWFYIFNNEFTMMCRNDLIFLAVNKNDRNSELNLLIECDSKRIVFFSYSFS